MSELHNISEACEAHKWEIVCDVKLSMHKISASKRRDQQSWCLESGLKQSRFLDRKGDQIRKGALKKSWHERM